MMYNHMKAERGEPREVWGDWPRRKEVYTKAMMHNGVLNWSNKVDDRYQL